MLSWVQDGLSDLERSAVDELLYMAVEDVANLEAVLSLPWVQDGISEAEYEALDKLGYLDTPNPANLYAALNIPWVQDDISEIEYDIIDSLGALDFDATEVVFQLFSMPFLLSPDATDALAIQGMEELADDGRVATLTDHAIFQDGITDDETTLIAAVGTLGDMEEIRRVLGPGVVAIETISLGTELTPHLRISIVRTDSQSRPGTVESVRDAVEFVEKAVGLPLPVDHVIVMLPFPPAFPGVQGDPDHGELLRRQIIVALFVAIDYHAQVGRVTLQQLQKLIDCHGILSLIPRALSFRALPYVVPGPMLPKARPGEEKPIQ